MSRPSLTSHLTYLTADIPGTQGVIKERPEDFLVDEQPLYQPIGQGEHLYLFLEKTQRTTTEVVHRLAKLFNVRKSDIGYAGLKDKHAITRQHFSVYCPKPDHDAKALERIEHTGLKLLWAARHTNKLRRGHLAGNRFVIRIRQVQPSTVIRAKAIIDRLEHTGIPNFIGEQRFGYRQNNHLLGKHYLLGQWQELVDLMLGQGDQYDPLPMLEARQAYDAKNYAAALELWSRHLHQDRVALDLLRQGKTARHAVMGMEIHQRNFLLSALQSAVFNQVLDQRLRNGTLTKLQAGDLAWKHDNGSVFQVDQAVADLENSPTGRVTSQQVSPSGPLWGQKMTQPQEPILSQEIAALQSFGIEPSDFTRDPKHSIEGCRRPLRTILSNPDVAGGVDEHGPYIRLAFDLAKGCYATVVLREIMKNHTISANPEEECI